MRAKRISPTTARRGLSETAVEADHSAQAAQPIEDPATATALKLWLVMVKAYHAAAELSRMDIARHGLTPAEFSILEALHHKGPLLLGDVQRKVLVSSGGTTFLIDRLAKRGLVERQSCPSDRRARYAALTPDGSALMHRVFPMHAEMVRDAMSSLEPGEQKALTALLKRLGLAAAAMAATHPECREGIGAA
jgi:MarR family 2-MHQ and catechol resistance regulon transcriptional repressor